MSAAPIESHAAANLGRILARTVTDYLKDAQHRREFEEWYRQKYGKEYEWR